MKTKKYLTNYLFFFLSLLTLSACSTIPGTLEVSFLPENNLLPQNLVLEELKPVLESILFGSVEDRRTLVTYTTIGCTNMDGLGGPPKCEPGQAEGTLVEVLPILSGEGTFATQQDIDQALDFDVMGLYAIYQLPQDIVPADYWAVGEYGLIFSRQMNDTPFPLTVYTQDGRIVNLKHHMGVPPEEVLKQVPLSSVILDPSAAEAWMAEHAPAGTPGEENENGYLSGAVCFPSESIPEMTLYFWEIYSGDLSYQYHPQNESNYSIMLAPGSYTVFAYPENSPHMGGIYSEAVVCGLGEECADHSPVIVQVKPGSEVTAVDICDWYSPDDVPPNPALLDSPGLKPTGSAAGKICYPSESIPEMTLYFEEANSKEITQLVIEENQSQYNVNLTPGQYTAYAYLNSGAPLGGSYSQAVICGLTTECSDHSLVQFDINPGETTNSVDICDWYDPAAVPPDPRSALIPLSSMVYRTKEGNYYWVEANGNSDFIFNGMSLAIPFTGPSGVYEENNDLYTLDLFSGETDQLTYTPDILETSYHFEVGLPEQILYTAIPVGGEIGPGYTGGLYKIDMDGSNQLTIDDEHNAGNFSASPDGQQIAYGAGETAFLFNIGSGIEVFDPRAYGMDSPKGQVITSPSWSPGGDNLAWFVSGYFDGQDTQGYGIFDMFSKSFQLIHPFQSLGMDITPPAAIWSQDGEWIAITVFDQEPARSGVWLVNSLNPNQEIFIGTASSNPVFGPWREDQKLLTYFKFDQSQGDSKTWIYDLVSGEHQLAPLPSEAQVIAWR